MEPYMYKNGQLHCESVDLADIAAQVGTPCYVYSSRKVTDNYQTLDQAFTSVPHLVCYSLKANSNMALVRLLAALGAGADIVSGGELFRALRAGIPASKIVYSGVGKTDEEIAYALHEDILMFNVESWEELQAINRVAAGRGEVARIAIRVNPEIDPQTHPYITTGMRKYKFGIPATEVVQIYRQAKDMPNIELTGIQMHIGSQLVQVQPIVDATHRLIDLIKELASFGIKPAYIDIGGGLGIRYKDENPESPEVLAAAILPLIKELGCTLILEPGRFIAGNAGVLLTKVLYTKQNDLKKFVIVDAAMNDLIRPTLYESYHEIKLASELPGSCTEPVDIVGPICESGDFFAHDRALPPIAQGDLLAVFSAGAYGFSMSSNYNARRRAAEVLVSGDQYQLARRRETYQDLIRGEEN